MDDRLQKAIDRRDDIKRQILERIPCTEYLTPTHKSGCNQFYACPFPDCGSGTHDNHTGAVMYYQKTNTFYCHACCKGGDVLKLIQAKYNTDYNGALEEGAKRLGLDLKCNGNGNSRQASRTTPPRTNPQPTQSPSLLANAPQPTAHKEENRTDLTSYFNECHLRLLDPERGRKGREYLNKRGLSDQSLWKQFGIGYDDNFIHPTVKGTDRAPKHGGQYITIPTSKFGGLARSVTPSKMEKPHIAPVYPLNIRHAFHTAKYAVFIVEGEIDALSLISVGVDAVALGGKSNFKYLFKALSRWKPTAPLILMLDNDADKTKGQEAQKRLSEELTKRGIIHFDALEVCPGIFNGTKDANEALVKDRELFKINAHIAQWIAAEAYQLEMIPGKEEFYKFANEERDF